LLLYLFLYRSFHDLLEASFFGSAKEDFPAKGIRGLPMGPALLGGSLSSGPKDAAGAFRCRLRPHSRALAISEPLRDRIFILSEILGILCLL